MNNDLRLLQAASRQHLYYFVRKSFETLHPGKAFVPAWCVEAMCRALERAAAGETPRLLITAPPRGLKSLSASVCLPAWMLGRDPSLRIIVASYGQDLAAKHARDFRTLIRSPWYRQYFPAMARELKRDADAEIITWAEGGRRAVSLHGPLTGFGADMVIIDDLMKAGEAWSEVKRQELRDFYEQVLVSRLDDKQKGQIIAVQQRLHEEDFAGYLLDKGNFAHLNLKAIAEEKESFELTRGRVHVRQKGEALCPERESLETLESIRRDIGSYAFSAQFQQNPVPPDGNRIRWEWFGTFDVAPHREELQFVVQSWDTAVTAEPTSDFSVCTTWGYREGTWHLLDLYRGRLEYPALKQMVIEMRRRWLADRVIIEYASSGIPLVRKLRMEGNTDVIGYRPEHNKEVRVVAQTDRLVDGSFLVPAHADWLAAFRHELQSFPNGRHDDQVDSLTLFLEWTGWRRGRSWQQCQLNGGRPEGRRRDFDRDRSARTRPQGQRSSGFNARRYLDELVRPPTNAPSLF